MTWMGSLEGTDEFLRNGSVEFPRRNGTLSNWLRNCRMDEEGKNKGGKSGAEVLIFTKF